MSPPVPDETVYGGSHNTNALQQTDGNASAAGEQPGDERPTSQLALGASVLLGIIVVTVGVYGGLYFSRGEEFDWESLDFLTGGRAETVALSVEVVDEFASKTYPHATNVVVRPQDQTGSTNKTKGVGLTAGKGNIKLGYGEWVFEVRQNAMTIGQHRHTLNDGDEIDRIKLAVNPYEVEATVTGGPNREPLEEATVEVTVDAGEWKQRRQTDSRGVVQFEIPRSASTVWFTATYGDLLPVESEYQIEEAAQGGVALQIADGTGSITVGTTAGGLSGPGAEVEIEPVSEQAYANDRTLTVDFGGRQQVENVPVGQYEVSANSELEAADTAGAVKRIKVGDGENTEVTLPISIPYRMSSKKQDRFNELRGRIDKLSSTPDRDVAIPRYYATVLTSMLELVKAMESSPERAVEAGFRPDETVEALLAATDVGITAVNDAMSERRNVSLFRTCASMPPTTIKWDGDATLDEFFDRVSEGRESEHRALIDRLQAVDSVLQQQWSEVAEIAPARKLHDQVTEMAQRTDNVDDELTAVAHVYIGIRLLDAVEGVFNHDALLDRLNSRVL